MGISPTTCLALLPQLWQIFQIRFIPVYASMCPCMILNKVSCATSTTWIDSFNVVSALTGGYGSTRRKSSLYHVRAGVVDTLADHAPFHALYDVKFSVLPRVLFPSIRLRQREP